jgi:hypothetical protein
MTETLRQAYADWLNTFPWDWYAKLTFQYPVSHRKAWIIFNDWKIDIKHLTGNPINYFMAMETASWADNPHLHLLLSGTASLKPYEWQQRWYAKAGWANVSHYDSFGGAVYYLSEKMLRNEVNIKLSRNLHLGASSSSIHDLKP